MATRLEELRARQLAICSALREASQALDTEGRRAQRAAQRCERAWRLVGKLRNEVLLIYWLAGCSSEAACKHLAAAGRQRHWPSLTEKSLRELVEDSFLQADINELAALADETGPADAEALRTAVRRVAEWRAVVWARNLNEENGVAPTTGMVLARIQIERDRLLVAEDFQRLGIVAEAKGRKFAERWRSRWGARLAKLRIQEPLTLEEMRRKVLCELSNL
jgi:hypothetical protein